MNQSSEVTRMLGTLDEANRNTEQYKITCVRIVERILTEQKYDKPKGNSKNFGPGKWNRRRSKFESTCGSCEQFIPEGTPCWLTQGESPRCDSCGKPEDALN